MIFIFSNAFVAHLHLKEIALNNNLLTTSTNLIVLPPSIRKLNLAGNGLISIEIRPLSCTEIAPLLWFEANDNLLAQMPIGLPIFGATIHTIILYHNPNILSIHAHEVADLTSVKALQLEDSDLKHISDLRHMAGDLVLNLTNNANLACDDYLAWLKDKPGGWTVDESNAVCHHPTNLDGHLLSDTEGSIMGAIPTSYVAPSAPTAMCAESSGRI